MKRAYLLRHAKSDWADPALGDFDRPLAKRGEVAAEAMGRYMAAESLLPDFALVSAARRSLDTWSLWCSAVKLEIPCQIRRDLYLASASRLLAALQEAPQGCQAALLLGHDPGIQQLALLLAGPGSDRAALASLREKYPTGALAVFDFDVKAWPDIAPEGGKLLRFAKPRQLP